MLNILLAMVIATVLMGAGCSTAWLPTLPDSDTPPAGSVALDLSGRGLTSIPTDTFSQTALEHLDLSDNQLTGAPQAEIRHLQNLQVLDLSGNRLTGLPAELGQLTRLEILDVSNNQLTGLPMELGNLTQLRVLRVSGNAYSVQDLDAISVRLPHTTIER